MNYANELNNKGNFLHKKTDSEIRIGFLNSVIKELLSNAGVI